MKVKGIKQARLRLSQIIKRLEKDRDDLREIQSEIDALLEDKDDDIAGLERVCDSLSKYVQQLLQPGNGQKVCTHKGCAGYSNGFCISFENCPEKSVSG